MRIFSNVNNLYIADIHQCLHYAVADVTSRLLQPKTCYQIRFLEWKAHPILISWNYWVKRKLGYTAQQTLTRTVLMLADSVNKLVHGYIYLVMPAATIPGSLRMHGGWHRVEGVLIILVGPSVQVKKQNLLDSF